MPAAAVSAGRRMAQIRKEEAAEKAALARGEGRDPRIATAASFKGGPNTNSTNSLGTSSHACTCPCLGFGKPPLESRPKAEARWGIGVSAWWGISSSRGLWGGDALLLSSAAVLPKSHTSLRIV
jgi:hypothetical protein